MLPQPIPASEAPRPDRDRVDADGRCRKAAWPAAGVPRVVALGGGTGLPNVLRGLRPLLYGQDDGAPRDRLVAIVATTDDGGSSGRLRAELGIIPPGDIRNCLAALSEDHALLADLFQYRFGTGDGLNGHALGNLFLAALADVTRDFVRAVELAGRVVGARGTVLPATAEQVTLVAELADGRTVCGETAIAASGARVRRLTLAPERPRCLDAAVAAIRAADVVVMGPGSLFTSILPPLLVAEIADAVASASAVRILVMNLMTEPGETDGLSAVDHLHAIDRHVGRRLFDYVLYSTAPIDEGLAAQYGARGARPVVIDPAQVETLAALGVLAIGVPLVGDQAPNRIRHHPDRLAAAVAAIAQGRIGAWRRRATDGDD